MRLYIVAETEKALLLKGIDFKERWIPKSAIYIKPYSERIGIFGMSFEMEIEAWVLRE